MSSARRPGHAEGAKTGEQIAEVLATQARYYEQRAPEYEDWWYRRGRYDHGPAINERWFAEAATVRTDVLAALPSGGEVLELACGTGLWTELLAEHTARVTAVDASSEMLALARRKRTANVRFIQADLFSWQPERRYQLCFFGFWLSHVPLALMGAFWEKVASALQPGGCAYVLDSARSERSSAHDHRLQDPQQEIMLRRLGDGREFHIVKHWFDPQSLTRLLRSRGWDATIAATPEFFVYGRASPPR